MKWHAMIAHVDEPTPEYVGSAPTSNDAFDLVVAHLREVCVWEEDPAELKLDDDSIVEAMDGRKGHGNYFYWHLDGWYISAQGEGT